MRVQFLGTGAAEGVPPLFSRSEFARRVRRERGPDLRTRSALRIGDEYQIDFGPDHFFQGIRCGCDFYDLEHLLITHTHADHIQLDAILAKEMPAETNGRGVTLYASKAGASWLDEVFEFAVKPSFDPERYGAVREKYPIRALEYFEEYTVGDLTVRTVQGNHRVAASGERSVNPLITVPDGGTMLYAVDTGYYEEPSWEYLTGAKLDVLVMETTFGGRTDRGEKPSGHLDAHSFLRMLTRMLEESVIRDDTVVYATHINPDQGLDHAGLTRFFRPSAFPVTVATDCLYFDL